MQKIIFICHGNICRSPMAEMIFSQLVEQRAPKMDYIISSAAVSYEEQGNGLYPQAASILREHNIKITPHRAHRITPEEAAESDLLIIMDRSNERLLKMIIHPEDFHKIHYLMEYSGKPKCDVSDPWYTRNFEKAYQDIFSGCKALLGD